MIQTVQTKFANYLHEKGLRCTPERKLITEEAFSENTHFEAPELLTQLKKKGASVSRATVYRTLQLLVECNLLSAIKLGENHTHYEPHYGRHHHYHLICSQCGKVIEFSSTTIQNLRDELDESFGFDISGNTIEITGVCCECKKKYNRK